MARLEAKLAVLRRRYVRGYNRERILGLNRFIDWLMALPEDLDRRFLTAVEAIEEENRMPYVTSAERIGREEGLKEGLREGLIEGIEVALLLKFGPAGREIVPEVRQLSEVDLIRRVHAAIAEARTIDDVRRVYA